ncbi:MAG TPA: DUF4407 domain-containing protein [Thermoanaerobaculia bacterium]
MTTLRKLLTLKPYGNEMLDGMAAIWLVLARVNIASIALCDAVAWGYFAYTTTRGAVAYTSAAIAGLIVFLLVASVDAMFVMHDKTQHERDAKRIRRDHLAVAARIVLVILTFTVTAPFLTQLFFARDIEANIRRRNEQTIAAKRAEVVARFDQRANALRTQATARQRDLESEIAGSGRSGRYGAGPTAAAIEREIAELQTNLAATEAAKTAELRAFDEAVQSPEVLANRYGIDLVREGPETRARVVAEMERSATFRATRRTIKAFLIFMFLGLVCLKLFQPESVRIYYSARLQAAYARFRAGVFDHRLDPHEQPGAAGMSPVRFADWYENDQQVRDATDRLRDQTASAVERMKTQEDAVRVLHETLRNDLGRMHEELAAGSNTNEELEQQVAAARHELDVLTTKIAGQQQALDDFRYDVGDDLSLADQQLLLGTRTRTIRTLAENRAAAARLAASLDRLTRRLDVNRAYENQLRESIAAAGTEMSALTKALQDARQKRLADILPT